MEPPHIREPPTPRVSMICVMMMMMIMKVKMMVMMMLTSPLLIYCWTDDIQKRRFICDCSGLGNRMTQFCFKNYCGFSMRPGEGTLPGKHQCLPRSCRHLWPGGSRGPSSRSCALGSEKLASCFFVWHAWLVIQRSVMFAKHLLNIYRRRLRDKRR